MNNNSYRYQLERYRGRGSRYTCSQCGRKQSFSRYIDTHNNNEYISGKCNCLDKCGYHYTPKQYFTDNLWKSDGWSVGRKHRETDRPTTPKPQPQWKRNGWLVGRNHRKPTNQPLQDLSHGLRLRKLRPLRPLGPLRWSRTVRDLVAVLMVTEVLEVPKLPNLTAKTLETLGPLRRRGQRVIPRRHCEGFSPWQSHCPKPRRGRGYARRSRSKDSAGI